MLEEEEPHNPKFVTSAQCKAMMEDFKGSLDTISKAIVGDDLRGGLVKDVADIKRDLSNTTGIVRNIGVPIIVAVVTAAIVYWISVPLS